MRTQTTATQTHHFPCNMRSPRSRGTNVKRKIFAGIASLLCIGFSTVLARADIVTLTINNSPQNSVAGQTVDYFATVSAPSTNAAPVFLNGDDFNDTLPFTIDDSSFYNTFPLSLTPGQSYTGLLFDIVLPSRAAVGTYTGSFILLGGPDGNTYNTLSTAGFTLNVTPEPSSILLLGCGLFAVAGVAWRRGAARIR